MTTKLKVCLIGATRVGKTSLTRRFVHSIFSDGYHTTIGVKIETREVQRGSRAFKLVIWDLSGEDEFQHVKAAYLAGAAGYLLVVDGTRLETVETARILVARVRDVVGNAPCVVVANKADLRAAWEVQQSDLDRLREHAAAIVETSARSGAGVGEAFDQLVDAIIGPTEQPWT